MGKTRHDYSTLLIASALLVTAVRYAGAFIASDLGILSGWVSTSISIGMGVTGVGMGILDVLGGAYIFDGWRRLLPASGKAWPMRFRVMTVFVFSTLTCGVGILVPFTVARVLSEAMGIILVGWPLWVWALLVNLAPYLVIGGVVVGQNGVVSISHAEAMREDAPHDATDKSASVFVCGKCGVSLSSQQALAAHLRWKHPITQPENGNGNGHKEGVKV